MAEGKLLIELFAAANVARNGNNWHADLRVTGIAVLLASTSILFLVLAYHRTRLLSILLKA
jgi:hypothetical protein